MARFRSYSATANTPRLKVRIRETVIEVVYVIDGGVYRRARLKYSKACAA